MFHRIQRLKDLMRLKQLARVHDANTFAKGVNSWLLKQGSWHDFKLSDKDGDKHQDITKGFLYEVAKRYDAAGGPLARAISRPELLAVLSSERVGIDQKNPIKGKHNHIDPAEYLVKNNSRHLLGSAYTTSDNHSFFYAAEYAKFHGLWDSYILLMALPRVFMTQPTLAALYPDAYTSFDTRDFLEQAPDNYFKKPEPSSSLAEKPEITIVTGVPGRPDIDLRPKMREVVGIMGINTPRKVRGTLFHECPTRTVHDCIINDGFAPLTYALEICGARSYDKNLLEIATDNAHTNGILPKNMRPLILEETVSVLDELHKAFPRLHRRGVVKAETQVIRAVPFDLKPHELLDYVIAQHKAFYDKEQQKIIDEYDRKNTPVKR